MELDDALGKMTVEQAAFVRGLRVSEERTWRWIAEECAARWGGDWDPDFLAGRFICDRAADLLHEDADAEPWN